MPSISSGGSGGAAVDISLAPVLAPTTSTRNLIQGTGTGITPLVVRGFAGQSADLVVWEKSDGTDYGKVDALGGLRTMAGLSYATKTVTADYTATANDHVILGTSGAGSGTWAAGVTTDAPVLWYRLNETGTTTIDDVGSGNHDGTLSGTYTQQATSLVPSDTGDKALNFSSAKIAVGDFHDLPGVAPFSIGFWAKPSVVDSTQRRIISKEYTDGSGVQGYRFYLSSTGGFCFSRRSNGSVGDITTSTTITAGTTYFVMVTYSGTQTRLFINGGLDTGPLSQTQSIIGSATSLTIGKTPTDTSVYQGDLDEVMIFDYRLADAEVQNLYDLATGGAGAGPITITLPAANALGAGNAQELQIYKTDTSAGSVTVQRAGSDTINGLTSTVLATQHQGVILVSDGVSKWYIAPT